MSLSKGARIFLLTVTTAFVVCVLGKLLLIDQQQNKLTEKYYAIAENRKNRMEFNEFFQKHNNPAKYESELNNRQRLLAKMLPDNLNVSDYLLEIQRQAANSGIVLLNVKPGKVKNENNIYTQEVFLKFQANYYQLNSFLQVVEQEERFAKIINMNVHIDKQEAFLEGEAVLLIYALAK